MIDRRANVHPVLLRKIDRVLAAMAALGFPMLITDGARTADEQRVLWRKGRETPGPIVTNADGITTLSNHQVKADGFGHAVDCAFVDPMTNKPTWDDDMPWQAYGELCKAVGLRWGIKLNANTVDRPHAELPRVL